MRRRSQSRPTDQMTRPIHRPSYELVLSHPAPSTTTDTIIRLLHNQTPAKHTESISKRFSRDSRLRWRVRDLRLGNVRTARWRTKTMFKTSQTLTLHPTRPRFQLQVTPSLQDLMNTDWPCPRIYCIIEYLDHHCTLLTTGAADSSSISFIKGRTRMRHTSTMEGMQSCMDASFRRTSKR